MRESRIPTVGILFPIFCYDRTIPIRKADPNMTRTKLADRVLPTYSRAEELMNTITHAAGVPIGILALVTCILKAASRSPLSITASAIYGASFIAMFAISAIYHGFPAGLPKKVLQVIDHCTIYFLIAGSYTAVALCALRATHPAIAWGLFAFEWSLALLAATFTAIDLKKYAVFSMICYIGMGWAVLPFIRQVFTTLTLPGFLLLLFGGIAYTIGSILYGLGRTRKWMHATFHLFVILGATLQYLSILLYAL